MTLGLAPGSVPGKDRVRRRLSGVGVVLPEVAGDQAQIEDDELAVLTLAHVALVDVEDERTASPHLGKRVDHLAIRLDARSVEPTVLLDLWECFREQAIGGFARGDVTDHSIDCDALGRLVEHLVVVGVPRPGDVVLLTRGQGVHALDNEGVDGIDVIPKLVRDGRRAVGLHAHRGALDLRGPVTVDLHEVDGIGRVLRELDDRLGVSPVDVSAGERTAVDESRRAKGLLLGSGEGELLSRPARLDLHETLAHAAKIANDGQNGYLAALGPGRLHFRTMSNWLTPLGFVLIAAGAWKDYADKRRAENGGVTGLRGGRGLGYAAGGKDGIRTLEVHDVTTIDQRVAWIRKGILQDSVTPEAVSAARWIVSQKCTEGRETKWCVTPKVAREEADALFWAIKDPASPYAIRYTNDHVEVDMFGSVGSLQRVPAGDCDDACRALGAYARVIGFPVRLVVIQTINGTAPEHIWTEVDLSKGMERAQWYALDTTEDHGPGWKVPANLIRKTWVYKV